MASKELPTLRISSGWGGQNRGGWKSDAVQHIVCQSLNPASSSSPAFTAIRRQSVS